MKPPPLHGSAASGQRPCTRLRIHAPGVWMPLLCAVLALSGCTTAQDAADFTGMPYPQDFALVLCVQGPEDAADPIHRPALFIIEPDRTLRASTGAGATPDHYPAPTATLSIEQITRVYELTQAAGLLEPATAQRPDSLVACDVRARQDARTLRHRMDLDQNQALRALVAELIRLRGG